MLTKTRSNFKLKGSIFTLSVLQLLDNNLTNLNAALDNKINQAPQFFQYAPIVVDLKNIPDLTVDFVNLNKILRQHKLIPVGVRNTNRDRHTAIQTAGFAVMHDSNDPIEKTSTEKSPATKQSKTPSKKATRIINSPIRSGQQIYAQGGDLVVLASVSPGAELLADGNIHIYGSLRGRALAGVNGNTEARVFCRKLQAELVSIAGQYQIFEDFQAHYDDAPKQLYLKDGQLIVANL